MFGADFTVLMYTLATGAAGSGIYEGIRSAFAYRSTRRPLRQFYAFHRKSRTWIVLSGVRSPDKNEFFEFSSPIDGVYSYDALSEYLSNMNFKRDTYGVRFAGDLGRDMYADNLILIGGYEHNPISQALNGNHNRSFSFSNNTIVEKQGDKRNWEAALDVSSKRIVKDYCLITRLSNPYCTRDDGTTTTIVAFEGVRHFGTVGGVRFANERFIKALRKNGFYAPKDAMIEVVIEFDVQYPPGTFSITKGTMTTGYENGKRIF